MKKIIAIMIAVVALAAAPYAKADACTGKKLTGQVIQIPNLSGYFDAEVHYGIPVMYKVTIVNGSTSSVLYQEQNDTFGVYEVFAPHCGVMSAEILFDPVSNGAGGYDAGRKFLGYINNYLVPEWGGPWVFTRPQNVTLQQDNSTERFDFLLLKQ